VKLLIVAAVVVAAVPADAAWQPAGAPAPSLYKNLLLPFAVLGFPSTVQSFSCAVPCNPRRVRHHRHHHQRSGADRSRRTTRGWNSRGGGATWLASSVITPFEASLFDDNDDDPEKSNVNPYQPDDDDNDNSNNVESGYVASVASPLAVPPATRLVLGVNKYSHDTTLVAADAATGRVLFGMSKERITRRKHDGGNVASLVELCLDQLNLTLDSIDKVVMNNHHHRIVPLEQNGAHMEWECGLNVNGGAEPGYDDDYNLLASAWDDDRRPQFVELSHHLAHAYSTAAQAPFESGICLVADGMGEAYRTMLHAHVTNDPTYVSDLLFDGDGDGEPWACVPANLRELSATSPYDYREAESLYTFRKTNATIAVRPIWKRFTAENSPPALYNHGFENMDSVGAVYSRASSTIFGDWNACGKVMGLAPWAHHEWAADDDEGATSRTRTGSSRRGKAAGASSVQKPNLHENPVMSGSLWDESSFCIDRSILQGVPLVARNDPDLFEALKGDADNMFSSRQRPRYDFDDNDGIAEPQLSDNSATTTGGATATATATLPATQSRQRPTKVALDAIAVAHRVQTDLERCLMDLVAQYKGDATNLCLAGGVALNSVANGRLARELGFDRTFVSPYPGDDGIAVGCCAYGLFGNVYLDGQRPAADVAAPINDRRVWQQPLLPYLGPAYTESDILEAIDRVQPWIQVETVRNENRRIQLMAEEIESGGVVAWFHSRVSVRLLSMDILLPSHSKSFLSRLGNAVRARPKSTGSPQHTGRPEKERPRTVHQSAREKSRELSTVRS
jgi:predicted NodU family carbamoyl transferase